MMYVALLRGINVGGNNKVSMAELKQCFEQLGLSDVRTYINSGNVIFGAPSRPDTTKIETRLEEHFGLALKVIVRSQAELEALHTKIPAAWVNDGKTMKCDVMFLWDEVDNKKVLDSLIIKPGLDDVEYYKGAIVWRVDRSDINKSGLLKIVGTPLYKQMTIRNINTLRKLVDIMKAT